MNKLLRVLKSLVLQGEISVSLPVKRMLRSKLIIPKGREMKMASQQLPASKEMLKSCSRSKKRQMRKETLKPNNQ
ncbi:hypothetical protein PO909_024069 [Leuciscus waleckii]